MLIQILVCILMLLFATTANGAEPVGSAEELLQLARDAQLTRESQWKEGTMDVNIETTGVTPMSAAFSLAWSDNGVYLDLRQQTTTTLDVERKSQTEARQPHSAILTPREEWRYFPSLGEAFGVGSQPLTGLPRTLDVRPANVWGTFPMVEQVRLSNLILQTMDATPDGNVSKVEEGVMRVDKETGLVLFIDVPAGGDLVRLEHNMHEDLQVAANVDPMRLTATYEWARDEHGVPYCRKFRAEHFRPNGSKEPSFVREVEVTSYNSQLSKDESRFDLARLEIPKGTKMRYNAPGKSRTWRHGISGSESKLLQQPDFERLIEQTKQSGFAAPKDE